MKRTWLLNGYRWGLLAVLLGIVLHAPFSVAVGHVAPPFAELAKVWKELLLTVLSLVALALVTRQNLWRQVLSDRVIQLSLGLIAVHLLLVPFAGGDLRSIVAGLMIDLRFIVIFILMYVLLLIQPDARRSLLRVTATGAVIVLGFGLLQVTVLPDDALVSLGYSRTTITPYTTIDSNPDYVRINSTLRGPNPLGALAVVYMALALAYALRRYATASVRNKSSSVVVMVASVAVLFATYSRSAYLAAVAAGLVVAAGAVKLSKRFVLLVGAGMFIVAVGLLAVSSTDWYSNVILHEDPDSTVRTKSNQQHVASLADGLARVAQEPFGVGIGSTGSASLRDDDPSNDVIIENQYFFVAHESGWLGLGIFAALYGLVLVCLWKRRSDWVALGVLAGGVGLGLIGLLLPVWADDTIGIVWWGLAGAILGQTAYNRAYESGPGHKKTTGTTKVRR